MDTSANPSFSIGLSGLQIAWDSTSMGALKKCPRFYQLSIIEGWAPREESVHLKFGILYHSGIEKYHRERALGKPYKEAMRSVVRWVLEETWNTDLQRPWMSEDPNKNRFTLVRSLIWYLDQYKVDPFETIMLSNGKPAVELSFRLELTYQSHLTGEAFLLCGHLDRLVNFQNAKYIIDAKTTKHTLDDRYFSQFTPDSQFSTYTFGGQVVYSVPLAGIVADSAQIAVGFTRFERRVIPRNQSQLDEWYRDLGFWLTTAQQHAKAAYWPMNDKACFGCQYRGICSRPPSGREQWLKAGFTRRQWNPLQIRGDV